MNQTELDMVNSLLRVINESAVNEIDLGHPDIVHALSIWDEYSTEIQSFGWWFNRETWQLTAQTDGKVAIPTNVIAIDSPNSNYIKKGRYLYDMENHTYDFSDADTDDLEMPLLMFWEIDELPPVMYNYILAMCKAKMLNDLAFDANKLKSLDADTQRRFFLVQKQQLRFGKPSATGSPNAAELLQNQPSAR